MDEADQYCDRVAMMHQGRIRALGTPQELKSALPGTEPTLEDVFRSFAGSTLEPMAGDFRDVRGTRRTAFRVR
jgi:ABC-2 type transport system ATP-binding protein